MRAIWAAIVAAACASLLPRAATAQPESASPTNGAKIPVRIDRFACASLPEHAIAAVLRVELGAQLVESTAEPTQAPAYEVGIDCLGKVVVVSISIPGGSSKSFETNLSGVPNNVGPRIIAIAIAEIVRDLDHAPPPAPPPPPPPRTEAALPAPVDHAERPRAAKRGPGVAAFMAASAFPAGGLWLFGGGLHLDYRFRRMHAGVEGALLTNEERFDLGRARTLLGYGMPYVGFEDAWGRARGAAGIGCALGLAHIAGAADDARALAASINGMWAAPAAYGEFRIALTESIFATSRAEIGWVALPVIGEVSNGSTIALKGLWTSFQLGISIGFGGAM